MKKISYAVLFLFLMASFGYGATNIIQSSLHPKYGTALVTSYGTPTAPIGNDKDNRMYYIQVPCTTASDTFYTWGFDISEYQAISVHYYCTTGDSSTDSTVSLKFGYEQSPLPTSLFASPPYAAGLLESDFTDSTGTASIENITPAATQYLRFYIISSATHNIAEDGIFHIRATFLKSPISAFHQGGALQASRIQIPNPYTPGVVAYTYWREGAGAAADTFTTQLVGANVAGTDQRIRMDGAVDFAKTIRGEGLIFPQDSLGYFSLGDWKRSWYAPDTAAVNADTTASDTLFFYRSAHIMNSAYIDSVNLFMAHDHDTLRVKYVRNLPYHRVYPVVGAPWVGPAGMVKQCIVWFRPSWAYGSDKAVKFVNGGNFQIKPALGDSLLCDGQNDIVVFTKWYGDAGVEGTWFLTDYWNMDDD